MESLATNYNSKFGLLPNQSPDFHEEKKGFPKLLYSNQVELL